MKIQKPIYLVAAALMTACTSGFLAEQAASSRLTAASATVLFRDDFNGAAGTSANAAKWNAENFLMQRTQFSGLGKLDGQGNVKVSVVSSRSAADGSNVFGGTNMYTKQSFKWSAPNKTIEIRARIKIPHNQKGIVHSLFTYESSVVAGVNRSNETDFEWLTNDTANTTADKVLVSSYKRWNIKVSDFDFYINDPIKGTHIFGTVDQDDTADWHTYVIRWGKDKIEFLIDDEIAWGEASPGASSDRAMPIFLNSWVSNADFTTAYNASLQPTAPGAPMTTWNMLVDYVEVVEY